MKIITTLLLFCCSFFMAAAHPSSLLTISSSCGDTVCASTPVIFTASQSHCLWTVNDHTVAADAPSYTYLPRTGDVVRCCATISGKTVYSNSITMAVLPLVTPSITIIPSADTIKQGETVSFKVITENAGPNSTYQWMATGLGVSTGNTPSNNIQPRSTTQVVCKLTTTSPCAVTQAVISNPVTITVLPHP